MNYPNLHVGNQRDTELFGVENSLYTKFNDNRCTICYYKNGDN